MSTTTDNKLVQAIAIICDNYRPSLSQEDADCVMTTTEVMGLITDAFPNTVENNSEDFIELLAANGFKHTVVKVGFPEGSSFKLAWLFKAK